MGSGDFNRSRQAMIETSKHLLDELGRGWTKPSLENGCFPAITRKPIWEKGSIFT